MRAVAPIPRVETIEKLIELLNDRFNRIQRELWDARGERITGVGTAKEATDALPLGQAQLLFGSRGQRIVQQIVAAAEPPVQQIINNTTITSGAVFKSVTLTAPMTTIAEAVQDGLFLVLRIIQDAASDRAITYNASDFESRADVNIATAANSVTILLFFGESGKWIQVAPAYQVPE